MRNICWKASFCKPFPHVVQAAAVVRFYQSHGKALGRSVGLLDRLEYLRINVPPFNQHLPARLNIEPVDPALDPFPTANQVLGDVFPSQLLLSTECEFRFRFDRQQTTVLLSDYPVNDHCLDVTDT